jgi:RNA polymerase sigma-70 factor (ECF subfamily)
VATDRSQGPPADALQEDRRLVERIRLRDERALGIVIRNYGRFVHGRANQILNSSTLVEEVAQDTFLALWLNPDSFDLSKGSLKTFLLAIAKHKAIDAWRHEQSIHAAELASFRDVTLRQVERVAPDPQRSARVSYALAHLSPLQSEALYLAYFGSLTHKQVAAVLRIPHSTAKTRVRDALIMMRKNLVEPAAEKPDGLRVGSYQGGGV